MTELTAEQKIAILGYIEGIERTRDEKRGKSLTQWSGIIGISIVGLLTGFYGIMTV